jgi:hypothetical protein
MMFLCFALDFPFMSIFHSSDIRNTSIFRRCSKRSIFKYLKKNIIKIQKGRKLAFVSSIFKYFLKSPKKCKICVCLNRIESMSLLCNFHSKLLLSHLLGTLVVSILKLVHTTMLGKTLSNKIDSIMMSVGMAFPI